MYEKIVQNKIINIISRLRIDSKLWEIDANGNGKISINGIEIRLRNYAKHCRRTSILHLFDAILLQLTQKKNYNRNVFLSISEYMKIRNLCDPKEARKQIKHDIHILYNLSVSDMRICTQAKISRGELLITFGEKFWAFIKCQYFLMPYPMEIMKLKNKIASATLLRRLAEHKNMNQKKPNEDIISIKTLTCGIKLAKNFFQALIKNLNAIETFSWEFFPTKPKNNRILTGRIKLSWKNYPETKKNEKR